MPNDRGQPKGLKDNFESYVSAGRSGCFPTYYFKARLRYAKAFSYGHGYIELEETATLPTLVDRETRSTEMPQIPAPTSGHSTSESMKSHV